MEELCCDIDLVGIEFRGEGIENGTAAAGCGERVVGLE
jgi:hypothetical protein